MADTQLNNIPTLQNEEPQIRLLRARRHVFYRGKLLLSLQMFLTLAVPVIGSILTLIWPDKRGLVALVAIIITILDVSVFDRILKVVMKTAAKLQEQFDCTVLQLPWNSFATGARVEPETIHAEARKDDERQSLLNWYPPAVGRAPIHLGRIICQTTNLWYDSKLRRQYGNIALATGIFLCIILLWIGWYRNDTIDSFVLSFVAPASPIIVWCVREYLRQRDAADALDRLRNQAEALWDKAVSAELSVAASDVQSREFQNAIFDRRANSPLTLIGSIRYDGLPGGTNEQGCGRLHKRDRADTSQQLMPIASV